MSTNVVIAVPKPGHWPVRVQPQVLKMAGWFDTDGVELVERGGCSRQHTIHQTYRLVIEEVTGEPQGEIIT